MNDREATQLLKQGNPQGLEFLVKRYQLIAIRTAFLIVRDRSVAEDIVQEAFIRVFDRIHQYNDRRPFRPWFLHIVVNDSVKHTSRSKKHTSLDAKHPQMEIPW